MAPAYTIEYAKSGRGACKGPKKVCVEAWGEGRKIPQGELRFGSGFEPKDGHATVQWRHWSCVTKQILQKIEDPTALAGFDDLTDEDKEKVRQAVETGEPPAKPGAADAKAEALPPATKAAPRKRKATKKKTEEDEADDGESEEEAPPAKKKPTARKASAKAPAKGSKSKSKSKKEEDDSDDDDAE